MRCPNCGMTLREDDKTCFVCGTPVSARNDTEKTMLADDHDRLNHDNDRNRELSPQGYENHENDDPGHREPPRRDRAEDRYYREPPRRYDYEDDHREDSPRPRYDGDDYYRGSPRRDLRRTEREQQNRKKKALIISIIALILVLAIVSGVIFFVNLNTVSAAELEEAKEKYLPPAQAVSIDTSKDDPSNDSIKFTYDSRARIISCSYKANEKTYDQSYSYNDTDRRIDIETRYRERPIYTKEIDYDRVTTPGKFEEVDGYYIRLDEQSVGSLPATEAEVSSAAAPKPTSAPTDLPTEAPTEAPTEMITDGYKQLYIDFLSTTDYEYKAGSLIYLNDDDIPELFLHRSNYDSAVYGDGMICWISEGQVNYHDDLTFHNIPAQYSERNGYLHTGMMNGPYIGCAVYYFDGLSFDHIFTYSSVNTDTGTQYNLNGEYVTKEEYEAESAQYSPANDNSKNIPYGSAKTGLEDYIRGFE